jgi:hypothetical protein
MEYLDFISIDFEELKLNGNKKDCKEGGLIILVNIYLQNNFSL